MTRVLLVDDHPLFRRGLAYLLSGEGFEIVGEAASGTEAVEAARELAPDLVVLDLGLPELHGIRAMGRILAESPGVRVVVLTMFDDDSTVRETLDAGADGYVLKDAPPSEILAALHATETGARLIGSGVTLPSSVDHGAPRESDGLTERERDVAALLTHGLGNRAIAARLGISDKTVANYVAALRLKLGAASRHDAARMLRER
ncbi:response regulator transcription factor [Galbitalea sp. SE-J8]|uniref:response regulator n=1 Tax=Galbitalea sp. SE-J8 TaxID=3054952 RepID=UPI00259C9581|nr:response regulator transcription factor [Galbitalea sp. SE-J8]MDM4762562.1 response regulator transcription factor [Galbitalea sp. SE-J8]